MARKNQRILTALGAAVGTGLAAYGIREGVRWYRRKQASEQFHARSPEGVWRMQRPEAETVPITGPQVTAPSMAGMSTAERVNSNAVADFDDRGMAFTAAETDLGAAGHGEATGEIALDEFVAPLIEHAIAFNSMMALLRSRQREGTGHQGTESLTDGDRRSMHAVLDQMQEHVVERDEDSLRKNRLALRSYQLTRKLREALNNLDYTGVDLFRIYDEVKKDLCGLIRDLERSGRVTITGLSQIRDLYQCS